ncbi:Pao retrotransposon peptidase [Popillia japonica]|uniref:Pao retrotransposon peptidase n=1 Tax=Popillia japonica TaxID=7064 RepID=A0AAW1K2N6_POPJA
MCQLESFSEEINRIKHGKGKDLKGPIVKLSPFVDETGILRVGGRLHASTFQFNKKHPVLLHGDHVFTVLLIEREHIRLLHAGPQQTLYSLRERYWPIRGRVVVKRVVHQLIHEDEPLSELPFGNNSIKTLGVHWNSQLDMLVYQSLNLNANQISKPQKKLCLCKLDWDDPSIPPELCQEWLSFCSNLQFLKDIIIPRQVLLENNTGFDLIGFCDASQHAYASCIYARSIDAQKNVKIELLCSKTKVAPLKVLTIPRLELMSAVLLAELMSKVSKLLTVNHEVSQVRF